MPSKIITNGRLEYLEATIDVTYPDIGEVTYRGSRPIIVSNQWIPPVKMPVKGDLIMLDGKQYRVLKMNDTVAEVLYMYEVGSWFSTSDSNVYKDSELDVYLSKTFYNSLSSDIQAAIVDKTFTQDSWDYSLTIGTTTGSLKYIGDIPTTYNGYYEISLVSTTFGVPITRKCYALSVQDVIDYLDVTTEMTAANTTLISKNLWEMFWNQTTRTSQRVWLRSAKVKFSDRAFWVLGDSGCVTHNRTQDTFGTRPAFQIDLSKVDWTKV